MESDKIPGMCKKIVEICTKQGKLDMKEFDRRMAMLVCDEVLDDMHYVQPPSKPTSLLEYNKLSKDGKFRFNKDNPDWCKSPVFQDYMEKTSEVDATNGSNEYWLKYWLPHLDTDTDRVIKVRKVLMDFNVHIPYPQKTGSYKPNELEVVDIFGGTVCGE